MTFGNPPETNSGYATDSANNIGFSWIGVNELMKASAITLGLLTDQIVFPNNALIKHWNARRQQCSSEKARHSGVITTHESFISDSEQTINLRCSNNVTFWVFFNI